MKTKLPIRVVVAEDWGEETTWFLALEYAKSICEAVSRPVEDVILLTHAKQLITSSSLSDHLGPQVSKALNQKKSVGVHWDARLRAETLQTLNYVSHPAVIIAFFADEKMMDFVDGLRNLVGVVMVPNLPRDAEVWQQRWNPIIHGEKKQAKAAEIISDKAVQNGLKTLSSMVNPTTGIGHPRDKEFAEDTFRILKAKGHALDPSAIKSWAIKNGWQPKNAESLSKLAAKIDKFKTKPRLTNIHDPHGRYKRWCGDDE